MTLEKSRCRWCGTDPLYVRYHDEEWGVPVHDDGKLFEFLLLETFQAGLSWITILRKRENFRRAFDDFDFHKISEYGPTKIERLLQDAGIIRNRLKIHAAIANAQAVIEVQKEFGSFDKYLWGFVNYTPIQSPREEHEEIPATTMISKALSKDMKKRGFKFVGSTVIYAFMQATGMVNDHLDFCFRKKELQSIA